MNSHVLPPFRRERKRGSEFPSGLLSPSRELKTRETTLACRPLPRFTTSHSSNMSNSSQYASSNPDSEHSTAPSSIHASADSTDEEHFEVLQRDLGGFVQSLMKRIKKQEESDILLSAWSTRCMTLETEVVRLSRMVQQLEAEKVAQAAPEVKVSSKFQSALHLLILVASAVSRPLGCTSCSPRIVFILDRGDLMRLERQGVDPQSLCQPSRPCHSSNRPQQEHEVRLRPRLAPSPTFPAELISSLHSTASKTRRLATPSTSRTGVTYLGAK